MRFSWKKLGLSAIVCAMLVPASLAFAKTSADFTDLKDLDAATKAKFDAMIEAGIFDGTSESEFGLKEEMNRAQFAKIAALITGLVVDKDLKTSSFSDVKADDPANGYALPYIEALKAAGITEGYGNGVFDPAGEVTKEQLATFLVRVLGKDADAKTKPGVNDGSVSDWAKGYVALALELKLLSNGADGKFGGQGNATRDLLVTGAYEAKEQFVPLSVSEAKLDGNKELTVEFSTPINPDSIDLSKFKINGIALDPKLDSFELSADGKTLIIKLRAGFDPGSANPTIEVGGVKSKINSPIVVPEKPVAVTVVNPPSTPIIYVPPVVSAPSVTSVTYSVYSAEDYLVDITVNYTPSGSATAYYVFTPDPSLLDGISAQNIKDLATGNSESVPVEYCSAVLLNGPTAYGTIDLNQSGIAQRKTVSLSGDQTMFLVIEKNGQFSGVYSGLTIRIPNYFPPIPPP